MGPGLVARGLQGRPQGSRRESFLLGSLSLLSREAVSRTVASGSLQGGPGGVGGDLGSFWTASSRCHLRPLSAVQSSQWE